MFGEVEEQPAAHGHFDHCDSWIVVLRRPLAPAEDRIGLLSPFGWRRE
jgi:hypothetical protein